MKKEGSSNLRNIFLTTFLIILISVGAWLVWAATAHTVNYASNNTDNTEWIKASTPVNYSILVNGTGADDIKCVKVVMDAQFTYSSNETPSDNWTCDRSTQTITFYSTVNNITNTTNQTFNILGTAHSSDMVFETTTYSNAGCDAGDSAPTSTTLKVDGTDPTGTDIAATDGTNTITNATNGNFTAPASLLKDLAITITANITESDSGFKNVTIFFTNDNTQPTRDSTDTVTMTTSDTVNGTRAYTGDISAGDVSDHTNVTFFILAIDNVLNEVYLNLSSDDPFNFTIDGSAPTLTLDNPINDSDNFTTSSAALHFNVTVNENYTISSVYIMNNSNGNEQAMSNSSASFWSYNGTLADICPALVGADNESCTLKIQANDSVGNSDTTTFAVYIDDVAPIIENATINDTGLVVLNNFTRFNITVDTQNNINSVAANTSSNYSSMTRGSGNAWYINDADLNSTFGCQDNISCVITLNATDVLGRSSYTNLIIWADGVEPTLYDSRANDTIVKSTDSIQFKVNVSDVSNFTINYANVSNSTGQNVSTMTRLTSYDTATTAVYQINATMSSFGLSADGTYILHFNATDKADNTNGTTLTLIVDDTEPTLRNANTSDSDNKVRPTDNLNITVNATDANSISTFTLRGDSDIEVGMTNSTDNLWYNDTLNISYLCSGTSGTNGTCTLYFNATDAAGNINVTNLTVEWDDISPIAYGASPNGTTTNNNSIAVSITISDTGTSISNTTNTPIYISVNGTTSYNSTNDSIVTWDGTTLTLTPNADLVFPEGTNTITVNATDLVGNSVSTSWTFTVDTTGPQVGSLTAPASIANSTTLTITAYATDDTGINTSVVYIDDSSYQNTSMTTNDGAFGGTAEFIVGNIDLTTACGVTNTLCADGAHILFVKVKDQGGTWSDVINITFTINSTPSAPTITDESPIGGIKTSNTSQIITFTTDTNSNCKFDTNYTSFGSMRYAMTGGGTSHTANLSSVFTTDKQYIINVKCNNSGGVTSTSYKYTINLDTISSWSIVRPPDAPFGWSPIGAYFANNAWNPFDLQFWLLQNTSSLSENYNVTTVLASVSGNYSSFYGFNGSTWLSYEPGAVTNSFRNFTYNVPTDAYYIYMNASNERIEIT